MSLTTLEREILAELREVTQNRKLTGKNLMQWSTGEVEIQKGETLVVLPKLQISCAVKLN